MQTNSNIIFIDEDFTSQSNNISKASIINNPRKFGTDLTNVINKNYFNNKEMFVKPIESFGDDSVLSINENIIEDDASSFIEKICPLEEYLPYILNDLLNTENQQYLYPQYNYIKNKQNDINEKMRVILLDWIVDVHQKWKLSSETLFLTINIIDRYLSLVTIPREILQCIGVSALLIACKYEQIYYPDIDDFKEITDDAFTIDEIIDNEYNILTILNFELTIPSILRLYEIFSLQICLNELEKTYSFYLLELSAFSYKLLRYKPSIVAAAIILIVIKDNINKKELLFKVSNYNELDLVRVCCEIISLFGKNDHGSNSIKRKYSSVKYFQVSSQIKAEYIDVFML